MRSFKLGFKEDPPLIFQASIHNLSMQCLRKCLRQNDPIFEADQTRIAEAANCINSCAFNYVKYRIEVKELFRDIIEKVDMNNENTWNNFYKDEQKKEK